MERKSFILYQSYEEQINCLTNEEKGILLSAIFEYFRTQQISEELPLGVRIVFIGIRAGLDRDHEKYERICARNAENGKKGGRPKKTQAVFEKADNDNGDDNDNDNVYDNGNGNGNGNGNENEERAGVEATVSEVQKEGSACLSDTAPHLTEREKKTLFLSGLPLEYIAEREERAIEYSEQKKKRPTTVLLEWWENDRGGCWKKKQAEDKANEKSYDTDAFFEASLRRSYEEFDRRYPKSSGE